MREDLTFKSKLFEIMKWLRKHLDENIYAKQWMLVTIDNFERNDLHKRVLHSMF